MTDKTLVIMNIVLMAALVVVTVMFHNLKQQNQGYFAQVPVEKVHTMRVWEDGSFAIEYTDNTSEVGCVPGGLCND